MERQWRGNDVDLQILVDSIVQFFSKYLFKTSVIKSEDAKDYHIIVKPKHFHKMVTNVSVFVTGVPNDFSVKFDAGLRSDSFVKYGSLTSFFGGGFIALKGFKSQEELDKLEKKFWAFVSETVWQLTNSVSGGKKNS